MIPAGAQHIMRPSISIAAQFAGIDYAEAVTGFDFVKNKASARVNGIIVAEENVEGLLVVWEGMMERVKGEEERRRMLGVLERWRRFIVRLGIKRRLEERHGKVDDQEGMVGDEDEDVGGGFLLGAVQDGHGFGTSIQESRGDMEDVHYEWEERSTEKRDVAYNEISEDARPVSIHENGMKSSGLDDQHDPQPQLPNHKAADTILEDEVAEGVDPGGEFKTGEESEGGGFMMDDDDSEGGGFIYEDEDGIL